MKPLFYSALALLSAATLPALGQNPQPSLPLLRVPQGAGINIHFTDPKPGEMKMLSDAYRLVRMDFSWGGTEKVKGVYDFSAYDRLLKACDQYKVRALFILDYSNPFYDDGLSPHTDEGRAAMAKWAGAAVTHFKGRGVLWEIYNEPNIGFWKPKPNVDDYILMDKAVAGAIRQVPGECYFGAATSTIDLKFLEACFQSGALERWDAVSVHPYRQSDPETVTSEYRNLRLLIERYKPKNKVIPIISGEWGYSTAWDKFNDERQGKYLPRQWMTNLMNDVPISIFYDWHDDGTDPKEPEHHFGTTENKYYENREPVYDPKPSYTAAKTFTHFFEGYDFNKRLALTSPDDYLLIFSKGDSVKLAVWTTKAPHEITIPASVGKFGGINYLGASLPEMQSQTGGLKLQISDAPLYLEPTISNDVLRVAARWPRARQPMLVKAPGNGALTPYLSNPLSRPLTLRAVNADGTLGNEVTLAPGKSGMAGDVRFENRRDTPHQTLREEMEMDGARLAQSVDILVTNPLHFSIQPQGEKQLAVIVDNPSGTALKGKIALNNSAAQDIDLTEGETAKTLTFARPALQNGALQANLRFEGSLKNDVVETAARFVPLAGFTALSAANVNQNLVARPDGDAKIESEQTLSLEQPAEGPSPAGGASLKLNYRFASGWKFANLQPLIEAWKPVEGQPKALGMWIYGDNSGNVLRMRYRDSSGQTFQPNGTSVNWKGWKYFEFPLDGSGGSWGGAADGKLHYPLQLESLLIFDSIKSDNNKGAVYISAPTWIY